MEQLTSSDFRRILGFTQHLYVVQNHENLIDTIVKGLQQLVRGDVHSYTETNHRKNTAILKDAPGGPDLTPTQQACYAQFSLQHPTIAYYQKTKDGQALKISDFLSFTEWRKTDLYNHVYLPHQLRDCLGAGLPVSKNKDVVMGFGIHRGKQGFTEGERTILNLVRPHLLQAYGNAQAYTQMERRMATLSLAVDQLNQAVVEVDEGGKILWTTEKAKTLLHSIERPKKGNALHLPSIIWNWMQRCSSQLSHADHIPQPVSPLQVKTTTSSIEIRFGQDRDTTLLYLEEYPHSLRLDRLHHFGLSPRETEVLGWVTQGKSNQEIAEILGIRVGTVKTHLERIYVKLGVDHRYAAMAKAMAVLGNGA